MESEPIQIEIKQLGISSSPKKAWEQEISLQDSHSELINKSESKEISIIEPGQ